MDSGRILVAGARRADLTAWAGGLDAAGYFTELCWVPERLATKAREGFDLLLLGLYAGDARWLGVMKNLRSRLPSLPIAVLAPESSETLAIDALRAHAHDYLPGVVATSDLIALAHQVSKSEATPHAESGMILGESQPVAALRTRLERLASSECNVLITGESGTGKELAALAIYRQSARRAGRLVCVNCAAIPEALVESELFGHDRGAFTGAETTQDGKLKAADGGVIFLDEIGDLSLFAQAKILRAVETKQIYRLGSHSPVVVDVRIIAATHRNLEEMVRLGQFRQDLFFRLNVGRVHVPPLRERIEDLHILVKDTLARLTRQMGIQVEGLSEEVWQCFTRYSWPGNIRELRNALESALVSANGPLLSVDDMPPAIRGVAVGAVEPGEREHLLQALLAANWNKSEAASKLQWSRMKLYRKMAKYAVGGASDCVA